jgi:hypothetical protein
MIASGDSDSEPRWGIEISFDAPIEVAPGESAAVPFRAWAEAPRPHAGSRVYLYEGTRLVGTGIVRP